MNVKRKIEKLLTEIISSASRISIRDLEFENIGVYNTFDEVAESLGLMEFEFDIEYTLNRAECFEPVVTPDGEFTVVDRTDKGITVLADIITTCGYERKVQFTVNNILVNELLVSYY